MTGFDIFDRYDFAMWVALETAIGIALALGVPLWIAPIVVLAGCIASFVRHFDENMAP